MIDLERRALLGDRQAQEECTRQGIVLPCWRCGGEAEAKQVSNVGRPLYAVSCKKHYCGAYGCAHRTEKEAISYWNTRPAPPIGRCKDCEHYTLLGHCKIHSQEPDEYSPGAYVEMLPDDFCSYFEPKWKELATLQPLDGVGAEEGTSKNCVPGTAPERSDNER